MTTTTTPSSPATGESNLKNARLEFRSTQTQKAIIERAAALVGESVTSFVLATVLRDARKVIREHQMTELSLEDWERFNAMLESDSEPNEYLAEAAREYKDRVAASDAV